MDAPDRDQHIMKNHGAAEKHLSMPGAEQVCATTVFSGNMMFFLLSLVLHTAVLAVLWFLAVPASGMGQGAGTGGYITVSLLSGPPGDSGGGDFSASSHAAADAASPSVPALADETAEPPASTPAPDITHAANPDLKQPDAAPAAPEPPVTAATAIPVRTKKDEQKTRPKSRKAGRAAIEKAVPEHARGSRDGRGQNGEKTSGAGHESSGMAAGRGGQGGEKGGASGEGSAAASGSSAGYLKGNYEYIKKRVRQYLVYNPQAKRMGIQGMVTVSFTIQQDGRVRDVAVSKSSGYPLLDESALEAVRSAAPFAAPPEPARVIMPVQFSLR